MKKHQLLLLIFTIFIPGLISAAKVESAQVFRGHSLKRLDVAGSEMVLIQLFVESINDKVKSQDDLLGVSQKGKYVSLYVDYARAHPVLKSALIENDYIRDPVVLKRLLQQSFLVDKSKDIFTVRMKH